MISVILTELEFHLQICTLGQFVIFYAITGSERYDLLKVLLIYLDCEYKYVFKGNHEISSK